MYVNRSLLLRNSIFVLFLLSRNVQISGKTKIYVMNFCMKQDGLCCYRIRYIYVLCIYIDQTMESNARFVSLEKKILGVSAFTDN